MRLHPQITQANGIIKVRLTATFVGDPTDANDKALIAAFGDPQVNLAGTFSDPLNPAFTFLFPATDLLVGITTQMSSQGAQFMVALPCGQNPNQPAPIQGALDCVTQNPSEAAEAWYSVMTSRIQQSMNILRQKMLVPTLTDATI
jgi:hypothetical protein